MGLEAAVGYERDLQTICFATEDAAEGRAAFKERRPGVFRGVPPHAANGVWPRTCGARPQSCARSRKERRPDLDRGVSHRTPHNWGLAPHVEPRPNSYASETAQMVELGEGLAIAVSSWVNSG